MIPLSTLSAVCFERNDFGRPLFLQGLPTWTCKGMEQWFCPEPPNENDWNIEIEE